ncbi:phage portal protein [Methylocystis rosea]|uniref:phage portal protein n=1 Tax=Methylocystis rosea TaxID=173366 RepID=UPI00037D371A|nr:phage portal protein [Methylocystis rosea]
MTFKPSFFDRALLAIAPTLGIRRLHARAVAEQLLRAFDGASHDRRLSGWITTGASANSENYGAIDRLRNRARDLDRNNKLVASARAQFAGRVVGTGITPRAVDPRKSLRKIANDAWKRFVETCDPEGQQDYYGMQNLAAGTMFRDGEVLRVWTKDEDGNSDGKIMLREADFLDSSRETFGMAAKDDKIVIQGVEFNKIGARTGYWLYPVHPGELIGVTPNRLMRGISNWVDAQDVDHIYQVLRPGQIRGASWLAPSITALRGLDDVNEAIIWRKRIEACIGLVIRTPEAQGAAPILGPQKTDSKGRIEETLSPGKLLRTGPGEDVTPFQPSTSGDTLDFIRSQLFAFSASIGVPYFAVTGDPSQANYSSQRAAIVSGNVLIDVVQWLVFAPRERRAWRRVMLREAILKRDHRIAEVGCELAMPVRPWVDPLKEIMAKVMEIRAGLQAQPDALAERGVNWEEVVAEIDGFLGALDSTSSKVVLDTDPRRINHAGALQILQGALGGADAANN